MIQGCWVETQAAVAAYLEEIGHLLLASVSPEDSGSAPSLAYVARPSGCSAAIVVAFVLGTSSSVARGYLAVAAVAVVAGTWEIVASGAVPYVAFGD